MTKDLSDTYAAFKILYRSLYERGYRSLGARTTSQISADGVSASKQDLENTEERAAEGGRTKRRQWRGCGS